jgi:hypothetical protein
MSNSRLIRILSVSLEAGHLVAESDFFPDRAPKVHNLPLAPNEIPLFIGALTARPFGASSEHQLFLQSITESAGKFWCSVRIASSGSRQTKKIAVCAATYEALHRVFENNIISEGYVRA